MNGVLDSRLGLCDGDKDSLQALDKKEKKRIFKNKVTANLSTQDKKADSEEFEDSWAGLCEFVTVCVQIESLQKVKPQDKSQYVLCHFYFSFLVSLK